MLEESEFLHRQREIVGRAENLRGAGCRGHGSRQPIPRYLMWIAALAALLLLLILMSQSASAKSVAGADESGARTAISQGAGGEISPPTVREKKRPVSVTRFEQPPAIDGQLDEAVWQRAAVLKDFYQTEPGDNAAPTHATEVRIGYDSKFLYVGIRALDERGQVRATVAKRDDLSGNDYTAIWLDTFDDRRKAYVLLFNPLGVQADGVFTEGQGIDYSVDLVMESRGVVSDEGYTVEVAVPFTSLRYEAGEGKLWGVHVLRRVRHLDEWDTWMPLRRESRDFNSSTFTQFLQQSGHITGIVDVGRERTLELIPTLTLSETGRRVRALPLASSPVNPATLDRGRFVNGSLRADAGLTAKVTLSSGVTLAAAINPDFAQVEADQLVVTANQRFPIFFEEKRPFFLEGVEIFQTPVRVVHTRTIVDPDWALKLAGKRNRNSFGLLVASDKAPGNFSEEEREDPAIRPRIEKFLDRNARVGVLRLKRDVGSQSSVGLIATSYDFVERHNRLFGVDGRFTLGQQTILGFQLLGTTSRRFFYDPDLDANTYRTGNGFGYSAQLQRTGRRVVLTLTGEGHTPDYRADVGFTTQTNVNDWSLVARYNSEPRTDSKLISWSLLNTTRAQFDWQGRMKYAYVYPRILMNFKRQTYLNLYAYNDYLRLLEEEFGARRSAARPGAFAGDAGRRTIFHGFTVEAGTTPSKKYSASIVVDRAWKNYDYDFGAGPRFPRVSPAALADPSAPLDPGTGDTLDINASLAWQPTDALRLSLNHVRSRLVREDTGRVAYDQKLYSLKTTYQFTRFTFARARADYDTLRSNVSGQFLFGWTPNPGTALYAGYNDDLSLSGFSPFTGRPEQGLRRNGRTFFVKMSYLWRRGL